MVCLRTWTDLKPSPSYVFWQVFSPAKVIFAGVGVLLLVHIFLYSIVLPIVTPMPFRQLEMFALTKKLLSTLSTVSKVLSNGSKSTLKWYRLSQCWI